MKKNLYAVIDTLGGFMLHLDVSDQEPEIYVETQNRINLMQPSPLARTIEFRHLGIIDDTTLQGKLNAIAPIIGNLMPSTTKLEAASNAAKANQE